MSRRNTITCGCGIPFTQKQFTNLPAPPRGSLMLDGDGGWLDLRNCLCRSTISRQRLREVERPPESQRV